MSPELGMTHCRPAEEAMQQDIIYTIATMLTQDDVTSMRLASASFRQPLAACVKSVAPRTRASEELCRRYRNVTDVSLHRHKTVCSADIQALAAFSQLTKLSLAGSTTHHKRGESIISAINELTTLTSLDLRGCNKLTWTSLTKLTSLTNLQFLNVTGVRYESDQYPAFLLCTLLSRLHTLVLGDGCTLSYVDDDLLTRIGSHATSLTHLDCSGCIDITDQGLQSLAPLAPNLKQLSLQSCVRLSQNGISSAVAVLPNLTTLNLRGCLQLFDDGLSALSVLTGLTELVVQGCSGIRGAGFAQLTTLKQLKVLNAKECSLLDSLTGVAWLSTLRRLNLSRCMSLKPEALIMLGHLNQLEQLDMTGLNLPGRVPHTEDLDSDLERWLCVLTALKRLDLSHFQHPYGVPNGLLAAISSMTALTSLCLAGVNPPLHDLQANNNTLTSMCSSCNINTATHTTSVAVDSSATTTAVVGSVVCSQSSMGLGSRVVGGCDAEESRTGYDESSGSTDKGTNAAAINNNNNNSGSSNNNNNSSSSSSSSNNSDTGSQQTSQGCCSACGGDCGPQSVCSWQLSFLSDLDLVHLDLSGWTALPPCALVGLMRLTGLKELKLGRLSNECVHTLGVCVQTHTLTTQTSAAPVPGLRVVRHAWEDHSHDGSDSDSDGEDDGWRARPIMTVNAVGPERACLPCTCDHTQPPALLASLGAHTCDSWPCCMTDADSAESCTCSYNSQVSQQTSYPNQQLTSHPLAWRSGGFRSSMESLQGHLAAWDLGSSGMTSMVSMNTGSQYPERPGTPMFNCQQPSSSALDRAVSAPPFLAPSPEDAFRQFFNQSLVYLSHLSGLEHLHLEACTLLGDQGLLAAVSKVAGGSGLPHLKSLYLGGCKRLVGSSLTAVAQACPGLTTLSLEDCSNVEESHMMRALPSLAALTSLELGGCKLLGDGVCKAIRRVRLSQLKSLSVRACTKITTEGVIHLYQGTPNLISLNLSQCWAVDDRGVLALSSRARCLTHLDLKHCWRVTKKCLGDVARMRPLLEVEVVLAAWPLRSDKDPGGEVPGEENPSVLSEGGLSDAGDREGDEEDVWGHMGGGQNMQPVN